MNFRLILKSLSLALLTLGVNHISATAPTRLKLLRQAIKKGQLKTVRQHLDMYPGDINESELFSEPDFLTAACRYGRLEIVQELLERGANVDSGNQTPLSAASAYGHHDIVKLLLAKGAKVNRRSKHQTPLHAAAQYGDLEMVKLLLDHGADVNKFGWKAGCCDPATYPLYEAADAGHLEIVKLLLTKGADVNSLNGRHWQDDYTPLFIASKHGDLEIVRTLLDAGANFNLCSVQGISPLGIASTYQHHAVVNELLKRGASRYSNDN